MVLYFGSTHSQKIFKLQKRESELQQEVETRTHVEHYLNSLELYCLNHSTFFLFFYFCEEQGSFYNRLWQS